MKTKKTVLIVEDEKPVIYALKLKLKNLGHNLVLCFDGDDAVNYLKKNTPDLILLDLLLPKINGFKILEFLKKEKKNIPVVVLSNLSQDEAIKQAKELGVVDYFIKADTHIDDIMKYVDSCLDKKEGSVHFTSNAS